VVTIHEETGASIFRVESEAADSFETFITTYETRQYYEPHDHIRRISLLWNTWKKLQHKIGPGENLTCDITRSVTAKRMIFWVIIPCSWAQFYRRFSRTYLLHSQCRYEAKAETSNKQAAAYYWFLAWLTLRPLRWMYVPLKLLWTSIQLHGIPTQKIVIFFIAAARTWSPTARQLCDCVFTTAYVFTMDI
jgi:hypothetical protein